MHDFAMAGAVIFALFVVFVFGIACGSAGGAKGAIREDEDHIEIGLCPECGGSGRVDKGTRLCTKCRTRGLLTIRHKVTLAEFQRMQIGHGDIEADNL